MDERRWNQTQLGAAVGVNQATVSRWLKGAIPDPAQQERLRELIAGSPAGHYTPPPAILGQRDLPVYSAVEGGPGEIVVSTDAIEFVPRPWYLGEVKEGFAVLVVGESMVPAFRPGELAIVNPRLPAMRGRDHILTMENENGEFTATIKHVLGWTENDWKLEQYNPPTGRNRNFTLPRAKWTKALRVVGKYEGV